MNKKILKYIKFLFCIMLIFSMMAPSYAAISSSDGSIFITKTEFDAAIVDLNARLTTFEAGINSKIDSQVTSYLDSNGIWNGQYFVDSKVEVFSSTLCPKNTIETLLTGTSVDKSKEFVSLYKYTHDKPCGKTGLCLLKLIGSGKAVCQLYKSGIDVSTYIAKQQAIPHLEIRDADTDAILTEYRLGQGYWVGPAQTTSTHGRFVNSMNTAGADILFFVKKENVLVLDFGFCCTWYSTSDNYGYSGQSGNSPWDFKIYMETTSAIY